MNRRIKSLAKRIITFAFRVLVHADFLLVPPTYLAAWFLKLVRRVGIRRLRRCQQVLMRVGVFPILDHYYEPQFNMGGLRTSLSQERSLPGIDWNVRGQIALLQTLMFSGELADIPWKQAAPGQFYFGNPNFGSGDAEFLYQVIRRFKPRRFFEVGSGYSTLMARRAIRMNLEHDPSHTCKHVCIEPYEMPWLEATGVSVIRKKIEDVGAAVFSELEANDILFLDSSHMIRPQGDVLFEYLELLPTLSIGVIVHVHDIFSPRNYPAEWLVEDVRFWNEQYLLEAFLANNASWKIIGALNFLRHHYYDELKSAAPYLTPDREPGSFYMQKTESPQ